MTPPKTPAKPFSRTRKTPSQTTDDIRTLCKKYGCQDWGYKESKHLVTIEFVYREFLLRFFMDIPDEADSARKHRVLYDRIRSNFVWVEDEGVEVQEVFGLHIVDPDTDQTVGQVLGQRIAAWRGQHLLPPGLERGTE